MSAPTVVRHADGAAFLDRAASWLLEAEAENNLLLSIADRIVRGDHDWSPPFYLATVEEDGRVVGCAWRTPPFKLGLTRMPPGAVPALVADVAELFDHLPAVIGEEGIASAFARAWSALRGVGVEPGMRQRIYRLDEVVPPARPPAGSMRAPAADEHDLLVSWFEAFAAEAHTPMVPVEGIARKAAASDVWLWDDGRPVCLAGVGGRSPNGVRIGPVYTPPESRRRGYASALVADLSQRMLDEGRAVCFLYTDLSNPTSNSIYRDVGYRPVADVMDVDFT